MVALMAVLLLVTAVIFALGQTLAMSGAAGSDNRQQLGSTAAFFLAESGVEHAQSVLRIAALAGTSTNSTCTDLGALPSTALGSGHLQGTFRYTAAVSTPAVCGGANPACTSCAVTVLGKVGLSSRSILVQMSANRSDGVEGYGHQFTLNLETVSDNTFAFTHLAYNPQTNWGGDAVAGYCQNNGPGSLTSCTESWKLPGTYYNNTASQGVFAQAVYAGVYTINEELRTFGAPPTYADRNYVQTGVTFRPAAGFAAVSHVGSFASSPSNVCVASDTPRTQPITYYVGEGSNTYCARYAYQTAQLDANWTCNPQSATTPDWTNAGSADTLLVGFGGKPYYSGSGARRTNQLSGLSVNGQALYRQLTMAGTQGDTMYSQIWFTYNPAYYATAANATSLAVAASLTASVGATLTGHTTNGARRFVLDSDLGADEQLVLGDTLMNTAGTVSYGSLGTRRSGTAGTRGAVYNLSGGSTISPNGTALRSFSTVMRLSAAPSAGAMALGDTVTNAAGDAVYGVLGSLVAGSLNAAGSTYQLTGAVAQQISAATDSLRARRDSTTITLVGATTLPIVGSALAVVGGAGQFVPDRVTASASGSTMTVTAATASNLSVGDALFGAGLQANTRITQRVSGSGGTGTYSITPSQTTASGQVMARAAVTAVASANAFTVSRLPSTRLLGAQLCAGVCPFLLGDAVRPAGQVDLTNVQDYDDWSAGFACLRGVDPSSIENLGTILSKRSGWSELVQ
jgi:hypothetical protein